MSLPKSILINTRNEMRQQMSDGWTQEEMSDIRRSAADYGWHGTREDGDVLRWIAAFAPYCLDEYRQARNGTPLSHLVA
jgi:hypothetical protein